MKWGRWNETEITFTRRRVDTTLQPTEGSSTTTTTAWTRGHDGLKSVRWSGWLTVPIGGDYTFTLLAAEASPLRGQ